MKSFTLWKLFFGLYCVVLSVVFCEKNICTSQLSCTECIAADPHCTWCKEESSNRVSDSPRCNFINDQLKVCVPEDIEQPDNSITIVRDERLGGQGGNYYGEIVQLRPKEVNLRLRPGLQSTIMLQFQQAEDFPVDVYYLVDLSLTVGDYDRELMISLGNLLADQMSEISSNSRIGFGSFVNGFRKVENLTSECPECSPPYTFRNHLSLTTNTHAFKGYLDQSQSSTNADKISGGFEAIMQSIVCRRQLGWRHNSRKILIVATNQYMDDGRDPEVDGNLHMNDGQCHMDAYGSYTGSSTMIAPSLSQLRYKAQEKGVSIIFATTSEQMYFYDGLARSLQHAVPIQLDYKESVLDLIKDKYNQLTSNITLFDNSIRDNIDVMYFSRCANVNSAAEQTHTCTGLKVGTTVTFEVHVELVECPADPTMWNQKFSVFPSGIHETMTVNLEMICSCDCDKPQNQNLQNQICKSAESLDLLQPTEVEHEAEALQIHDDSTCKEPNSTQVCSGQGECVFGACKCFATDRANQTYYGKYCECDSHSCETYHGQICNGRGLCICGICMCEKDWTGAACQCNLDPYACVAPGDNRFCSDHGQCACGQCSCDSDFFGKYCDDCPTCPSKCENYRDCVECKVYNTGPYDAQKCQSECRIQPTIMDEVEDVPGGKLCTYSDEEECTYNFVYGKDFLHVQRFKECPGY